MVYDSQEIDRFKREIDLRDYAAAQGYHYVDRPTKNTKSDSDTMKHPLTGEKIAVNRVKGHWVYKSVYDESNKGTIIDFIQRHKGGKLGEIRRELREWLGTTTLLPQQHYVSRAKQSINDRDSILRLAATLPAVEEQAYLKTRAVGNKELLSHPRFSGRIHHDPTYGAACFFYEDGQGVCGVERRNKGFKGFAAGSQKGIWRSNCYKQDKTLVFTEGVINALSYYVLHPEYQNHTRYMALGGGWSDRTKLLLESASKKHPGSTIILAFDNDTEGQKYEAKAREIIGKTDKHIITHFPETPGIDWNKQLTNALGLEQQPSETPHRDRLPSTKISGYKVR